MNSITRAKLADQQVQGITGISGGLAQVREVRRYEIAKAVMAGFATDPRMNDREALAETAIAWADALLAELEK